MERFSAYHILLRVTARILSLRLKPYTLKRITNPITNGIKDAMQYWILESQRPILNDLVQGAKGYGKFRKLRPLLDKHGVYAVGGRAVRWFQASYNKRLIPILPKDKFAQLYVEMVHNKKHCGIDSDVTTIRLEYWLVGLRKMCTDVKGKCVHCRKFYAKSASQIMGMLPLERLKPTPAWNSIGIDLFGPFVVKGGGEVNKRSFGKGYGVIFFVYRALLFI